MSFLLTLCVFFGLLEDDRWKIALMQLFVGILEEEGGRVVEVWDNRKRRHAMLSSLLLDWWISEYGTNNYFLHTKIY